MNPLNVTFQQVTEIIKMKDIDFNDVIAYDASINTVSRPWYLTNIVLNEHANGYVALKSRQVVGYGIIRPAIIGFKMYPLYADTKDVAKALFCYLRSQITNEEEHIYTSPEKNDNSNEIIMANGFKKTFSMV